MILQVPSESTAVIEVCASASGYLVGWDGQFLGNIVVKLGGGRLVETDKVDHAVNLVISLVLGRNCQRNANS